MKKLFRYLTRQPFWVNLLVALSLVFLIGFLFLQSLTWFTHHGEYLKVPEVKGQNVDNAIKILESQGFDVVIQDSVYFDSIPRYTVIKQLPEPDATVKVNRTVYLTINRAAPPAVTVPKLEGLSYRFAYDLIRKNHLVVGDTIYRPDFMKGSVLEQQYNGSRITAGTQVPWGARITLIIGGGLEVQQMLVPNLIGMTFADVKALLETKGITLAGVIPQTTVRDTLSAFVYKQNPERFDVDGTTPLYIRPGQTMDVWLSPIPLDSDSLKKKDQKDLFQ
ncbi:MAG TPA: PASTA domain-containing protein [Chitinophagaceae bacterium]|nr:PASTA domain-containing protein [Chitinophagaceae bacterium]